MSTKYPTCGHEGCQGHVGKFSSCLDEVLWQFTLDSADETFGDTDWHGHYAVIEISDDPSWTQTPESSDVPLTPRPGVYVVMTAPSGAVAAWRYDTPEAYEADMDTTRAAYDAWSAQDGDW